MAHSIFPCMWCNGNLKEIAAYYTGIFKNSKIASDSGIVIMLELNGSKLMLLDGSNTRFPYTEATSLVVPCDNQEEIDHYWNALTANGGEEGQCGWLKDKYGFSWQITPVDPMKYFADPVKGQRAMQAMMKMRKLVIAELENPA